MVVPMSALIQTFVALIELQRADPTHKVMVFFATARTTQFFAELFCAAGMPIIDIHSRKSQSQRTKASEQFRKASPKMCSRAHVQTQVASVTQPSHSVCCCVDFLCLLCVCACVRARLWLRTAPAACAIRVCIWWHLGATHVSIILAWCCLEKIFRWRGGGDAALSLTDRAAPS